MKVRWRLLKALILAFLVPINCLCCDIRFVRQLSKLSITTLFAIQLGNPPPYCFKEITTALLLEKI